jgi:hypothetical protein
LGAPEARAPSAEVMGAAEACARRVCRDAPPYSAPARGGKRRWRMAPAVVGRLGAPEAHAPSAEVMDAPEARAPSAEVMGALEARAPSAEVMGALEECACRACRHAPTLPRPRWGREAAVADVSRCRGLVGARRRRALPVRR